MLIEQRALSYVLSFSDGCSCQVLPALLLTDDRVELEWLRLVDGIRVSEI